MKKTVSIILGRTAAGPAASRLSALLLRTSRMLRTVWSRSTTPGSRRPATRPGRIWPATTTSPTYPTPPGRTSQDGVYLNTATQVNFPQGIVDLIKGEEFTTEMQLGATQVTGDTWGTYLNAATDAYSLFYRLQDDAIEFKNGSNARPCKQEIGGKDALSDSTITVVFKVGEPSKIYINGELAAEAPSAATAALAVEDYFFGHAAAEKSHTTEYIKFRFYDRALTADRGCAELRCGSGGGRVR